MKSFVHSLALISKNSQKPQALTINISGMGADAVAERLLRANYLPRQRTNFDELPPVFDSTTFSLDVAKKFKGLNETNPKYGHDAVTLTLTRADGHLRQSAIPHPAAYANLVLTIRENWGNIYPRVSSGNSYVKPRPHKDGRIIVMNYQNWIVRSLGGLRRRMSNHFLVQADVANFFPSIYTHSIAWALVGIKDAKASDNNQWFDKIDQSFQRCKRKETNGVAIGPATSNIAAEIIMSKIDDSLTKKGFNFYRYIDDFTCFTPTRSEAEKFINTLRRELDRYKLVLNAKKTKIHPLPRHNNDEWLYHIKQVAKLLPNRPRPSQVVDFIDSMVEISERYGNRSAYKYGFAILSNRYLGKYSKQAALSGCISLCFQVPNLHSSIRYFEISLSEFKKLNIDRCLVELLHDAALNRRTDAMCWYMYYCNHYGIEIPGSISAMIIKSRDCLSLLLLHCYSIGETRKQIEEFARKSCATKDAHDRHQYWMLNFELYRIKYISKVRDDKQQFDMMAAEGVHFCTA
ncbi:MAG: RNA-directed DNA polymerase [Sphingopyxis sp.]|uniref:RNA-directed DNA polymerase n=1 Tax=Sphingopyxis sp. TaxID=1908224 RepID=UPI003D80C6A5